MVSYGQIGMEASPVKHSNITLWTTVKTDADVLSPNLKNKTKKNNLGIFMARLLW